MIVYTGGTFDVPHIGHVNFLYNIKRLFPESYLVVSLNTDEFIKRYKGKPPVFSYEEREKLLSLLPYIDRIVPNIGDEDSRLTILSVKPDVIAIGTDWLKKDYCKQMGFTPEWLEQQGISLIYIPYTEGINTSTIKKRLSNV